MTLRSCSRKSHMLTSAVSCSFRASHQDHLAWSGAEHLRLHFLRAEMSKNRWTYHHPPQVLGQVTSHEPGGALGVNHHGLHVPWQPVGGGREGSKPETQQPSEFSGSTHCHIQFSVQPVFYFALLLLFFEREEAIEMYWHWEIGSKLYVSLKQPTNQQNCCCAYVQSCLTLL